MRLVTVATKNDGYLPYLRMSCERHGARLEVLGWGEAWRGWTWRMGLVEAFLRSCDPAEPVCFIDAYDVLLLRPLEDLERAFSRMVPDPADDRVVAAQDYAQNSFGELGGMIMFGRCGGVRVNAGTYVGRARVLIDMMTSMRDAANEGWYSTTDDQVMLTRLCAKAPERIVVDRSRALFLTVANHWRNLDIEAAGIRIDPQTLRLTYAPTGTEPCLLHAPAMTRLDSVLWRLGYPIPVHRGVDKPWAQRALEAVVVVLAATCIVILVVSHRAGRWCACPIRPRR